MSRHRLKTRDKITQKMSRDGVVEHNSTTGEDRNISKHETEISLKNETSDNAGITLSPEAKKKQPVTLQDNLQNGSLERGKYSNAENKTDFKRKIRKKTAYRHNKSALLQNKTPKSDEIFPQNQEKPTILPQPESKLIDEKADASQQKSDISSDIPQSSLRQHSNIRKYKIKKNAAYKHNKYSAVQHEPFKPESTLNHESKQKLSEPEQLPSQANVSAFDISPKPKPNIPKSGHKPNSNLQPQKHGKLQFNKDETKPEQPKTRKLSKAEHQYENANRKLEKAQNKLPAKRKLRSNVVFDKKSGKAKRKLQFEKEIKPQGEHLKGAIPLRPVKAGINTAIVNIHSKIYQVEHENVGVKAAHRAEMVAEGGIRSAIRYHKTAPYRKVAKLENRAKKKSIKLTYQKTLAENPKLKSNIFSRMWQKRKIKKDYAKKAREAQKAAKQAKKAGSATVEAGKAIVNTVRKHPIATIIILLFSLLLMIIMSMCSMGGGMGSNGLGRIFTSSYLAEDTDIDNAEIAYTEWEVDLQFQINNTETDRPGYDEYRYNIGNIGHNPYELIAYLTAVYQDFKYDAISGELRTLFDEQYILTFTESIETRYADPTDANEDGDYEPYEWKILTVTLTSRSFNDVVFSKMNTEQVKHYSALMMSKGGRQYVGSPFNFNWLFYVTSNYGWRIHPITGEKDLHRGIDIGLPAGTEIQSVQDGTVTFAGYSGDYGNVVIIENDKGITTKYAHCDSILVSEGQKVKTGDIIATVGNTGSSTGPHLHFEILKDGQYLNPAYFTNIGG